MATNIGYCTTNKLSSEHIAKVLIPSGGLVAGNIVVLDSLASSIANNFEVYTAGKPATAGLAGTHFAMIQNGGIETLADGRRPDGQPDYTKYTYGAGDVVTAVFLDPHLTFEVGVGTVTNGTSATPSSDIGKFIVPADDTYVGDVAASNSGIGMSLKIVAVKYLPLGGFLGLEYAPTYVCIAQ